MKIGILTFHRSVNCGAVMQAYSLSKRLKKEYPDDEIEIIDYNSQMMSDYYSYSLSSRYKGKSLSQKLITTLWLIKHPGILKKLRKRTRVFDQCINKLPLSPDRIVADDYHQVFSYITNRYDCLIVGSDAVWNYIQRGFPNAYFPDETVTCKKNSYAASCYGMDFLLQEENKSSIKQILDGFDLIGVRDSATEDFVKWSGSITKPIHTCDPTAFLDVNDLPIDETAVKEKLRKRGFDFERPTIGMMGGNRMLRMIRTLFGKKYQVVALYEYIKDADVNLYDLEPYDWAYVFRYFKLTFTTYFHAVMLSLRSGVPVLCVALPSEFSKNHTPKTLDLLQRLGYESWYFSTDYRGLNYDLIRNKADELLHSYLYLEIIQKMDEESKSFDIYNKRLRTVLEDAKNG